MDGRPQPRPRAARPTSFVVLCGPSALPAPADHPRRKRREAPAAHYPLSGGAQGLGPRPWRSRGRGGEEGGRTLPDLLRARHSRTQSGPPRHPFARREAGVATLVAVGTVGWGGWVARGAEGPPRPGSWGSRDHPSLNAGPN